MHHEEVSQELKNLLSIPIWDWDEVLEDALEVISREYFQEGLKSA